MSCDTVVRKPAALLLPLLLLAVGCTDVVAPEMEIDLEPGIDIPQDTDESGSVPVDPDAGSTGTTGGSADDDTPPIDPDDSGTDGSSGEPNADGGPPACDEQSFQLSVEPPQVMLVLDKSYSMIENQWDHDGDPLTSSVTRWNSLYNVVDGLVYDVEASMELGMVLFPSPAIVDNDTDTACLVDEDPGAVMAPLNADAIVAALPGPDALDLYGGTPTSAGLMVALQHLSAVHDGRSQAVVLVTDGAANCMAGTSGSSVFTEYDEDLAPMVAEAFADGIPTYVVGVDIVDAVGVYPQDNPYARLSELAVAGGVPRDGAEAFYNTIDEQQLVDALGGITAELGCTLALETPALFANQLTVRVDGVLVPRVDECGPDGVGWRLLQAAAPYESIELCATSCDAAHVAASLDVTYTCPPQG